MRKDLSPPAGGVELPTGRENFNPACSRNGKAHAFAALDWSFCGSRRTDVGRANGVLSSGAPSKSTISLVRYGFSL